MARRAKSSTTERTPTPEAASSAPAAAKGTRRGSKSKAPPPMAEELTQIAEQPADAPLPDIDEPAPAPSSTALANADAQAASPAARWDAASGTASFDWPIIEAVAAAPGPNQALANLLLAARAEGANSRWPF